MAMKENKLRRLLNEGKPSVSTRLWSPWAFYTEALGSTQKFDYMEFVAEYAPFDQYDLENLCRAAEIHDMASMIKVDFQNRGYVTQKAICSGFQAIMFADHESPEQVRETIKIVKPKTPQDGGIFGYPNRRYIGTQSHIDQMAHAQRLRDIVLCFMIEKAEMVDQIDEVCSIPGVDMIQFGPSDFCMSLGLNRSQYVKEFKEAERHCIEVALKHGVQPRCEIGTAEEAQYYIDLGVKHFSVGDQFKVIKAFWDNEGKKMRDIADAIK